MLALQMMTNIINDFAGDVWIIPEDLWYRFMGVLGITGACGTVAVPILHRVSAIRVQDETHTVDLSATIKLVCPRCGKEQQLALGRSRCGSCGLRIRVEIEEEHCRNCGYVLYKLESAVCPECGTPVAQPTPLK
ncbi:MAG: zinc ribbon domain-containing protein [Planctomycetes bacterium]|nr:zinc ribbon domain-containing protein [Planctomycetota bacterium]